MHRPCPELPPRPNVSRPGRLMPLRLNWAALLEDDPAIRVDEEEHEAGHKDAQDAQAVEEDEDEAPGALIVPHPLEVHQGHMDEEQ